MPNSNSNKDIELRSEKVRSIIGQIPPRLLRIGISIISLVVILVSIAAYTIPYPEYQPISITLYSNPNYQFEKAHRSGIMFIDTNKTQVLLNEQIGILKTGEDSIVYKAKANGKILYNCNNGDYLEDKDIIFSIIPDSIDSIYGICYLSSDQLKYIRENDSIEILLNDKSLKSKISQIYPINKIDNNEVSYKVRVSFYDTTNIHNHLNNKELKGSILISNTPVLRKILHL
ncbi:MAG: HlyD family efflux transporter periplasmic adaptor subunit [Dysgonomonas sp.]|nr:HlyD family efflux transporter periplasmic adaptor subunit [Dysgonomonas sp.]